MVKKNNIAFVNVLWKRGKGEKKREKKIDGVGPVDNRPSTN